MVDDKKRKLLSAAEQYYTALHQFGDVLPVVDLQQQKKSVVVLIRALALSEGTMSTCNTAKSELHEDELKKPFTIRYFEEGDGE